MFSLSRSVLPILSEVFSDKQVVLPPPLFYDIGVFFGDGSKQPSYAFCCIWTWGIRLSFGENLLLPHSDDKNIGKSFNNSESCSMNWDWKYSAS